jgi:hypothetical protein
MGGKWQVSGYLWSVLHQEGYYSDLYMGNSFFRAAWTFIKNRNQYGCIKLERRK